MNGFGKYFITLSTLLAIVVFHSDNVIANDAHYKVECVKNMLNTTIKNTELKNMSKAKQKQAVVDAYFPYFDLEWNAKMSIGINYKKMTNANKNKKNFIKSKSIKSFKNNIFKEKENNKNGEDINIFNKKTTFSRKRTKEVSFKLNNMIEEIKKIDDNENDNESRNEYKNLVRNFSSISKESTMYKTKKKFYSSTQLKNYINNIILDEKNTKYKKLKNNKKEKRIIRSFSTNNSINNNLNKINNNNNIFGNNQFITALNPIMNKRNSAKILTDNKSSKSFFFNKIKAEKKFLTYFDIKKIYFLDKKVYKPNEEFEKEINKLKRNNSNKFIMNFNFDSYKMTILNLFQKYVSHQSFDTMKKNFELINKAWIWKDNLKCHTRKKRANSLSQTEREMKYNQNKIDRENRIKSKNVNNNKKENEENYFI